LHLGILVVLLALAFFLQQVLPHLLVHEQALVHIWLGLVDIFLIVYLHLLSDLLL
jgi:hypothetical protein